MNQYHLVYTALKMEYNESVSFGIYCNLVYTALKMEYNESVSFGIYCTENGI